MKLAMNPSYSLCLCVFLKTVAGIDPVYVVNGGNTCIKCPANVSVKEISWFGPPNYMAYAVGREVEKNYSSAKVNDNNELCINEISKTYFGNYTCYGTDQNKRYYFRVVMRVKPRNMVTKPNDTVNITEHQQTVLSCSITEGVPAGVLQWTLGNEILQSDKSENISITIAPNTSYHGKVYSCQALDDTGLDVLEKEIRINVFGRPVTPTLLKETAMSTSSVTIKWNPTYDGGNPQTFVVQYRKYKDNSGDEVNNTWRNITVSEQNYVVLQNLAPGTHYSVRMYAFNKVNRSENSAEIMVSTSDSRLYEDYEANSSGYYALIVLPVLLAIVVMVYFIRDFGLLKTRNRSKTEIKNAGPISHVIDVGPGAVGNDLYGQANIPPPNRQNDEVQVYSSFDRRHNITLSTHAQSASYDVRPKQKPNNGRNKKKATKEKRPTNETRQIEESQNAQQLNYVEVSFDTQRSGNRVKIHGKKQPSTDYVDIDFTKKFIGPPVQPNNADSDDDFESEYEIKKMKRRTKLQEK